MASFLPIHETHQCLCNNKITIVIDNVYILFLYHVKDIQYTLINIGSINEDEFPYNYDKSKGFYYEACYSPDKKQIATSHSERGIEIFDVDTKELIKKVGNKSAYSIRYSPSCVLRTIRVRNNKHLTNLVANKSILSAFWISIY